MRQPLRERDGERRQVLDRVGDVLAGVVQESSEAAVVLRDALHGLEARRCEATWCWAARRLRPRPRDSTAATGGDRAGLRADPRDTPTATRGAGRGRVPVDAGHYLDPGPPRPNRPLFTPPGLCIPLRICAYPLNPFAAIHVAKLR